MSKVTSLVKRIDNLLSAIERKQQQQERICTVLLCNAAGEPLPTTTDNEQARNGVPAYIKRIILTNEWDGIA